MMSDNNIEQRSDDEVGANEVYIKGDKDISSKQALLIIPITKFFTNKYNLDKLINILSGESVISLRLIDWFVTNYCKKNNTIFDKTYYEAKRQGIDTTGIERNFDNMIIVHSNYKGQLKECSKKQFDPFCRRKRVRFYYGPRKYFLTTVGQLNFFKWAIENYIVDYIEEHFREIEDDMNIKLAADMAKSLADDNNSSSSNVAGVKTTKKKSAAAGSGVSINGMLSTGGGNISGVPDELLAKSKNMTKKMNVRKKKKELVVPFAKTMSRHNIPSILTFD
jgi:hypothetical protein